MLTMFSDSYYDQLKKLMISYFVSLCRTELYICVRHCYSCCDFLQLVIGLVISVTAVLIYNFSANVCDTLANKLCLVCKFCVLMTFLYKKYQN